MAKTSATAAKWAAVWEKAQEAGRAAAAACVPEPMYVGTAIGLSDRIDTTKRVYRVAGGVCGFAWVKFPGNTSFARWARETGVGRTSYTGGTQIWAGRVGGQSMEIKEAWAQAVAEVLREAGIKAFADSRMD